MSGLESDEHGSSIRLHACSLLFDGLGALKNFCKDNITINIQIIKSLEIQQCYKHYDLQFIE